ncbi:hypothetical protein NECAME_08203 [Necator americanus]|uniref:Uncharacterized protein n=1 Tax=Necator americanus TaxID=51031 RepID=W2TIW8_NECAM|nr:hypothetical protein NECAME_08203 [Necator americanus]ETN82050.1 hypothetical protein NECAME_08203 [Necator americanus]
MYERIVIVLAVVSATSSRPDESIVNGDQTASESAISWAEKAAKGVGNFFSKAGDEISGTAVEAWNATQDKAGEVADVLNGAAGTVAEHGERLAGEAKTWATGAVETVKREGEKAANATGDALIGFGETVKQVFLYSFVPYEKVQSVFHENRASPVRFALALEPLVYAAEPWEMQIPVNKRIRSAAKVEFIRNCVFRHFNVPNELQEDIWKNVRVSLNCRARRHRTSARSTPTSGFRTSTPILLEIESDDSNENGNK